MQSQIKSIVLSSKIDVQKLRLWKNIAFSGIACLLATIFFGIIIVIDFS